MRYSPTSVDKNLADALNMMTQNLRAYSLGLLRDQDLVGKIRGGADHVIVQDSIDRAGAWAGVDVPGVRGEGGSPHSEQERVHGQDRRQVPGAADPGPPVGARPERPARGPEYREEADGGGEGGGLLQESGLGMADEARAVVRGRRPMLFWSVDRFVDVVLLRRDGVVGTAPAGRVNGLTA